MCSDLADCTFKHRTCPPQLRARIKTKNKQGAQEANITPHRLPVRSEVK